MADIDYAPSGEPSSIMLALKSRGADRIGALYYVSFGWEGPVKIGWVSGFSSLSERLRGLQTACPYDLVALAVRKGSVADERALHDRFRHLRLRGEWFRREVALMKHIGGVTRRRDCQEWLPKLKQYAKIERVNYGYPNSHMGRCIEAMKGPVA